MGPNLGVVELTLALHYVFDTPRDSLVFDVSHQAYVHKMLTGPQPAVRDHPPPGGLNGFMLRTESEHDCYGAGHAGTALRAALGMAVARDMSGGKEHVVALCGDAALPTASPFEALNNIAAQTKRLIIVLNDNKWSIDKNVGAIASTSTRSSPVRQYQRCTTGRPSLLESSAARPCATWRARPKRPPRDSGRSIIFEEFGLSYYGPVDGHDLPLLIGTFQFLKTRNAGGAARDHAKGTGLPTGEGEAEEIPWPRAVRSRDRRDQAAGPADLLGGLR